MVDEGVWYDIRQGVVHESVCTVCTHTICTVLAKARSIHLSGSGNRASKLTSSASMPSPEIVARADFRRVGSTSRHSRRPSGSSVAVPMCSASARSTPAKCSSRAHARQTKMSCFLVTPAGSRSSSNPAVSRGIRSAPARAGAAMAWSLPPSTYAKKCASVPVRAKRTYRSESWMTDDDLREG